MQVQKQFGVVVQIAAAQFLNDDYLIALAGILSFDSLFVNATIHAGVQQRHTI
jgi:hypothetical protein